ncbi:serine hydrolase domain-containing protein [Salininema proteolyticum]|uniref:Serine hydrolase domain-containing protein n=1 Tax=Salininema proteolyticum TaxID=1607685 RepID=A0ABV8U3U9_9ACTN
MIRRTLAAGAAVLGVFALPHAGVAQGTAEGPTDGTYAELDRAVREALEETGTPGAAWAVLDVGTGEGAEESEETGSEGEATDPNGEAGSGEDADPGGESDGEHGESPGGKEQKDTAGPSDESSVDAVHHVPGVVHTGTFGDDGDGEPVKETTPFLWGSVGKPMTSTLILSLQEDGLLDTADPVSAHLPDFAPVYEGEPADPTIAQLLSHSAGTPPDQFTDAVDLGRTEPDAVSEAASLLDEVELAYAPGTGYQYNSADYLLLGAIVESVTGATFAEQMRVRVFDPLGMDVVLAGDDRMPPGHRQFFGFPVTYESPTDVSGLPYGGTTGGDLESLSRFAAAMLGRGELDGSRVLTEESVAEAWEPHVDSSVQNYGYGWSVGELAGGEPAVWHTGATVGYESVLIVMPEAGKAVAVMQNTFGLARGSQLVNASLNAAAVLTGAEREDSGPDPALTWIPWVGAGLTVVVAVWLGVSLKRGRSVTRSVAGGIAWAAGGVLVSGSLLVVLPHFGGLPLVFLWRWLPDIALVLTTTATAFAALAAVKSFRRFKR